MSDDSSPHDDSQSGQQQRQHHPEDLSNIQTQFPNKNINSATNSYTPKPKTITGITRAIAKVKARIAAKAQDRAKTAWRLHSVAKDIRRLHDDDKENKPKRFNNSRHRASAIASEAARLADEEATLASAVRAQARAEASTAAADEAIREVEREERTIIEPGSNKSYLKHTCNQCKKSFARADKIKHHKKIQHDTTPKDTTTVSEFKVQRGRSRRRIPQPQDFSIAGNDDNDLGDGIDNSLGVGVNDDDLPHNDESIAQDANVIVGGAADFNIDEDENTLDVGDNDDRRLFRIYATVPREHPRFGIAETTYYAHITDAGLDEVTVNNLGLGTVIDVLVRAIQSIIRMVTADMQDNALVQLVVSNEGTLDYPIYIPPTKKDLLTVDLLLDHLTRILQSNQQFILGGQVRIEVTTVSMPLGGMLASRRYIVEDRWLQRSASILTIPDDRCLARASVLALAHLVHVEFKKVAAATACPLNPPIPAWIASDSILKGMWRISGYKFVRTNNRRQSQLADMLIDRVGLPVNSKCGIPELKRLQDRYLTPLNIRLIVFGRRRHCSAIFRGGVTMSMNIYLYYNKEHYSVVTSPTAFISTNYFCSFCQKAYSARNKHRCDMTCWRCRKSDHAACVGDLKSCTSCCRWFAGDECFANHINLNTCQASRYCSDCQQYLCDRKAIRTHICGQIKCYRCCQTYDGRTPVQCALH